MPLMDLVLTLIVVGLLLWLVNRFIPMQRNIKSILNGVVVIAVVLWLLQIFRPLPWVEQNTCRLVTESVGRPLSAGVGAPRTIAPSNLLSCHKQCRRQRLQEKL